MSKLSINRSLNGINSPLSYLGINAVGTYAASQTVTVDRAPTVDDYNNFILGCFWIMPSTSTNPAIPNSRFFYLAALSNGQATWVEIEGVVAAALTITGDAGGSLSPVADNWNIVGGTGISTSGAGNTLTITNTDPASDLTMTAESGGPIFPLLGNWIIEGGTGITTSGAGNTITIDATGGGGGITGYITTTYSTPGSGTHVFDASTQWVDVFGFNGGCGGGSGGSLAPFFSSPSMGGGTGGGGGGMFYISLPISAFGASFPYTVGAGGIGGAAKLSSTGNDGAVGGITTFGTVGVLNSYAAQQSPAGYGRGGGADVNLAGGTSGGVNLFGIFQASGGTGGRAYLAGFGGQPGGSITIGTGIAPNFPLVGISSRFSYAPGGGGGGAGYSSSSPSETYGGNGGRHIDANNYILTTGGAGGIDTGTINGSNGIDNVGFPTKIFGGTGGGGGAGQVTGANIAGNGGTGGFPGGGGGGGGGAINDGVNSSGAGGNGADGALYIIEYY